MTVGHSMGAPVVGRGERWLHVVPALAVGSAFFALWFWLLPGWLGFRVETAGAARWRWLAAISSVLGFAVALRCVWDFGRTGGGTPAPMAPPKCLVVVGFHRLCAEPYVRGFRRRVDRPVDRLRTRRCEQVAAVAAVALGVRLFVLFYEESTLRSKFGADYEAYCRNVRRWWPRLQGWDQP
jgi:hypothetical protein